MRAFATVIAPTSVLAAVLFYFGYVSSRSQYEYFGIDVDTIGLGTQDYIMRSPQPLLVPLLVLTLIGVGAMILHAAILDRIAAAGAEAEPSPTAQRLMLVAHRLRDGGLLLLATGVVLLFAYGQVHDWPFYDLVTPLLIAIGGSLAAYGSRIAARLRQRTRHGSPSPAQHSAAARRTAGVLIYCVIAAGVFWATATVAQWSGLGLAQRQARELDRLPSVVLDTRERLDLRSPGIDETSLPPSEGQTFHYRYRNLKLLIEGHDRMFLVPDTWSASDSTLMVPLNGSVRVQFRFVNQMP